HDRAPDEPKRIAAPAGEAALDVFEEGVPPRFRLSCASGAALSAASVSVETIRPDGTRQVFGFAGRGGFLESIEEVPEPHEFAALVTVEGRTTTVAFEEHEHAHGATARDNNMRA